MSLNNFYWVSAHLTDKGKVRSINEDACLDRADLGIWVVADGMGGHAAGDLASGMIVSELKSTNPGDSLGSLASDVEQRLQQVNHQLQLESEKRGGEIIGSTVVTLLAYQGYCIYQWAGDSRIYLYRRGILKQLNRDHSQVEELIEQGIVTSDQVEQSPIANYITRAVGAAEELELEAEIFEPCDGDLFLLCSDGLNKEVRDAEIAEILSLYSFQEAIQKLINLTMDRGARDNVTLVLVQAQSVGFATPGET
ncbi:MAG: protein phosphatase 2C domain-containing protein [Candidatus Thiodiazotropha sp.]|nr:protein phosphatase 2C domain-containing protein [Candidatus Thiodiazotropha sp.]MCM8885452.1 protein phosphatase 2C domain-containing protein [Candidatus Thiodiazotropha sp.]MCM8921831.1 protein phosphatase 2C domain-containing protein [Candidatus Thiodiazotropha sp.]